VVVVESINSNLRVCFR